jgi:hypothetical protein
MALRMPLSPDDNVRRVLDAHDIHEDNIQQVRSLLTRWFARRPPDQPQYLVPMSTSQDEHHSVLTSHDMVTELEKFSQFGRSYVELFIAGGLTNPHVDLDEVLARLEHDT